MNILGFNDEEFKEAILNNIENKENINEELLDSIIQKEVGNIASSYSAEIELQNSTIYLKKYYTEHMVNKEDYDYLEIDGEDNALIRINNIDCDDFKGTKYFDFLVCINNTDVYDWQKVFIKRSDVDEDFEEIELDDTMWRMLDFHIFDENNN